MPRPAQFDRETVLEQATNAFWQNGYCNTSLSQLVEVTHLQPGSIYAAFTSKEGLYLAAIDHYGQQSLKKIDQTLAAATTPLQGIRDFLEQLKGEDNRGCFLVNSVLELSPHNPTIAKRVNHYLDAIEKKLRDTLESAQQAGELPPERSAEGLAQFLMVNIWGIRVLARRGSNKGQINTTIDQLLTLLN
ncbi:MAG: TetR/AcrR family transcriptional regulator [Gammaproteobacteria bacterium]|nr:TetR/AcrR family transcriptional regulator [Gammaproteobacteria bacterium]